MKSYIEELLDWLKEAIEEGRIDWKDDAPYVQGLIESIEDEEGIPQ